MNRRQWRRAVGGLNRAVTDIPRIIEAFQRAPDGTSGAFRGRDTDGREWWVKTLNNAHGPKSVIAETIVNNMGRIIDAPVCNGSLVDIPDSLRWEFLDGSFTEKGIAYASANVAGAIQRAKLQFSDRDDNRRRHAGAMALYDWCWGDDEQWLYSGAEDQTLYSHDHGWYLPGDQGDWSTAGMVREVNRARNLRWHSQAMDGDSLEYYASKLRGVTASHLLDQLAKLPAEWPVSDDELATVGWFLERRAPMVASRLERRSNTGGIP